LEFALPLLSLSPAEPEALAWSFSDPKRLLDHFLASGSSAEHRDPEQLARTIFEYGVPARDLERLRRFAHRDLPKAASNAAMLERVADALDEAIASRKLDGACGLVAPLNR